MSHTSPDRFAETNQINFPINTGNFTQHKFNQNLVKVKQFRDID